MTDIDVTDNDFFDHSQHLLNVKERYAIYGSGRNGWSLRNNIIEWIETYTMRVRVIRKIKDEYSYAIFLRFDNDADAILFKMRWL